MTEDQTELEMFAILDDHYARTILEATRRERLSAKSFSEEFNMSITTASRRVNRLLDNDLLVERTHIDPAGHHYSEYEAKLGRVEIQLIETGFQVRAGLRENPADRFTRIWQNMRNA